MGLINQDIKNLVSGISQQPPILRHPEQLEEQLNGLSTEADGLQKRPPTVFQKVLKTVDNDKTLVHFIDRDDSEKYCVLFNGEDITVHSLWKGDSKTYSVTYKEDKEYIECDDPRRQLKMVTIADYTFITNTTVETAMSEATTTNYWDTQGILVNIKSGQYGRTYKVVVNGTTIGTYTTPDGSESSHTKQIATDYIANKLAADIKYDYTNPEDETTKYATGWTVSTGSSWLYIKPPSDTTISSFAVYDGYNNQAAYGFWKTTQKFSNLPATAPNNFTVLVKGEDGSDTDDYYVKYNSSKQVWQETVCPNIQYKFDLSTMPHVLVREASGNFTFKRAAWSNREIGDEDSNPLPSFIGETINDVFYHRNRVGFLAGENVILSRSADFFNFWMQSATKVQDTDPIDLAVSDNNISTLYNAVPYDKDLIVFSKEAQFALTAQNVLTPTSATLTPAITHYLADKDVQPINAGRNIYFIAKRATYSTVREFFTAADNTEAKDVQDITSHVPNFIINGVYKIIPSTVENIMLFLSEGSVSSMYVYKYLFVDGQRVQAAWSLWEFKTPILGASFVDDKLYIVLIRNNKVCLEAMSFNLNTVDDEDYENFRVLLDSKKFYTIYSSSYDSMQDQTTVKASDIFGNTYNSHIKYGAVADDGTYVTTDSNGNFVFLGNYSGVAIAVGIPYTFKVTMSPIMVKQTNNGNTQALTEGRLQLRQMWFNYKDTGYFDVTIKTKDKGVYTYSHTARVLGAIENRLDNLPFATGSFKFPIQCKNENATITLSTDAPLPVSLVGAGWIGNYQRRTRLY